MTNKRYCAVVTGASRGIGRAIAERLLQDGLEVIVTGTKKDAEHPIGSDYYQVDFLNDLSTKAFVKYLKQKPIDILINNAGINKINEFESIEIDEFEKIQKINLNAPFLLCQAVIPHMKKNNWGRIVNITSCAGLENSGPVTYTVSKAALTAYTRTMGRILATEAKDVVMTAIFPGVVVTKGGHWDKVLKKNPARAKKYLKDRAPLGRFGKPNEIAPVVAFYCSEFASFSHGAIIPVDAGQSRHYMYFNYLN